MLIGEKSVTETNTQPLLAVKNLKTHFFTEDGVIKAVDGVDLYVAPGEVLGLVGESGCGKSVTSLSIMRLIDSPGRIIDGSVTFENRNLLEISDAELDELRGNRLSMIFQQPQSSLNPVFTIGDQVAEVLQIHNGLGKEEAWQTAIELLRHVGIPDTEKKALAYPHEISGGQAQRVMIAMALALNPQLLIADEPTTALDVTIQAQILDLVKQLSRQIGTSVILITHDLGVIVEMADRVAVMYAGQIIEETDVKTIFARPLHPYSQGLVNSIPILGKEKDRLDVIPGNVPNLIDLPSGCRFAPRCRARVEFELTVCSEVEPDLVLAQPNHKVRCWLYQDHEGHHAPLKNESTLQFRPESESSEDLKANTEPDNDQKTLIEVRELVKHFPVRGGLLQRVVSWVKAVDNVSFHVNKGETLGLVGESGCGKTTVGRTMLRLIEPTGGSATFDGVDIFDLPQQELKDMRRNIQIIFQDPYASLDPRMQIGKSIAEGLRIHNIGNTNERNDMVIEILRKVGLEPYHARRYPHQFSGGQRQRIGIARALALQPKFIVCDEPVSALDVSIQSQVLNILADLQEELGLTYLFIAHDLSVVEHISDRVAVMYLGKLVEMAGCKQLFSNALHPYTQALMSAIPVPDTTIRQERIILKGDVPSPLNPPHGCRFHPRCPVAREHCAVEEPPFKEIAPGHWAACWLVD